MKNWRARNCFIRFIVRSQWSFVFRFRCFWDAVHVMGKCHYQFCFVNSKSLFELISSFSNNKTYHTFTKNYMLFPLLLEGAGWFIGSYITTSTTTCGFVLRYTSNSFFCQRNNVCIKQTNNYVSSILTHFEVIQLL